jgi:hypothetical protein
MSDRPRGQHLDQPPPDDGDDWSWPLTLAVVAVLTMVNVWLLLDRFA